MAREKPAEPKYPIVIGHRGASGYAPEHTLPAYLMAIEQGADFIEPDLVMTRDGHLVARHDNVLNLTTDVASRSEFADRKTTKIVDGAPVEGWFSEDFTLAEMKRLRAIERMPNDRPANQRFDGLFQVPVLAEILELAQAMERVTGRRIGLYPETKHPTYFKQLGLPMGEKLVSVLGQYGYRRETDPVFIQSFEIGNLQELNNMTRLPLVQLLGLAGKPYDVEAAGGALTYAQMASPAGLREIAKYADGVGPEKYRFIIPRQASGQLDVAHPTSFVQDAHGVGLLVHPYVFRAENKYLPADFQGPGGPTDRGDAAGEVKAFLETGIDGFFIDQPDIGVKARDEFMEEQQERMALRRRGASFSTAASDRDFRHISSK